MSIKLYDAYRVEKSKDIRKIARQMTDIAAKQLQGDRQYLKLIFLTLFRKLKNPGTFEEFIQFFPHELSEKIKEATIETSRGNIFNMNLEMAVSWDDDYWYVVFFPDDYGRKLHAEISKKMHDNPLEDYHYQNQTDPPDGVSEEEYEIRYDKWCALTDNSWNFSTWLHYTVFGYRAAERMFTKNYFEGKGEEELYAHLAYNFGTEGREDLKRLVEQEDLKEVIQDEK